MPVEAATNAWTKAEDALAATLPKLAEFRVLVGAADEAAAAVHVFWHDTDEPLDGDRANRDEIEQRGTIAIIYSAAERAYRITIGPEHDYYGSGRLVLAIERVVPQNEWTGQESASASRGQVYRWFENRVGRLIDELVDYWWEHGGPYVRSIDVSGPLENDPHDWETCGRLQLIEVVIEWGLNVGG